MLKMKECLTKKVIPLLVATSMAGGMITQTATITLAAENDEAISEDSSVNYNSGTPVGRIAEGFQIDGNKATATLASGKVMRVTFLSDPVNTFRLQIEDTEEDLDKKPELYGPSYPEADMILKPLDNGPSVSQSESGNNYVLSANGINLYIDKTDSRMKLESNGTILWEEEKPLAISNGVTTQTLKTDDSEYFYGGGHQNGRFSHKGKKINIANESTWNSGGVSSPTPLYISNKGYGVMRHTWKDGVYDFGSTDSNLVTAYHNENRFDAFYFVGDTIPKVIEEFTTLTGKPALLPEYAFYEGHANAYNRDYWKPFPNDPTKDGEINPNSYTEADGKTIVEMIWPDEFIKETLNGPEPGEDNYEYKYKISGRKVIDDYVANDMPIGWFLPNDGYGAGYGQEDTLDGNIQNLKKFVDYAKKYGMETGLWTQQNIMPVDPDNPQPNDRDIEKEVGEAGVRALKTDVAWVGPGYSFEVAGVRQAAKAMKEYGNNARPFIISLDGWTGTQEAASLWSGDQSGGLWEYIRFHIPSYIGSGLSGNPNVGSDMDGIWGANNPEIHTRDFQWKAFTPVQINMDGWSTIESSPVTLERADHKPNNNGETTLTKSMAYNSPKNPYKNEDPYKSINRMYLKLKAEMLPYTYSISAQASSVVPGLEDNGKPMIRAMMLEYPDDIHTYGTETQYQYMYGKNLLVAPIYEGDGKDGPDLGVRNNIYLPDENQIWIDYFTGEQYQGGNLVTDFETPLWKLPLFVKNGAIIPMTVENNSPVREGVDESVKHLDGTEPRIFDVYPDGDTEFTLYEDDGTSLEYLENQNYATTKITSSVDKPITDTETTGTATITVESAQGNYASINKATERGTEFIINLQQEPSNVKATIGGGEIALTQVTTQEEFDSQDNVYFYNERPNLNKYSTATQDYPELPMEIISSPKLYVKVQKTDVTTNNVVLTVEGFNNVYKKIDDGATAAPTMPTDLKVEGATPYTINLVWNKAEGDAQPRTYEVEVIKGKQDSKDKVIARDIKGEKFKHSELFFDTEYFYRVRAVNSKGKSEWTEITPAKTEKDPYRNIPKDMKIAKVIDADGKIIQSQGGGESEDKAFDLIDGTMYHSNYGAKITFPAELIIDMGLAYNLDKFEYLPRDNAANGTFLNINFAYGLDSVHWKTVAENVDWARNADVKTIDIPGDKVWARYIKLTINSSVGGFLSAAELTPYKIDGTLSKVEGDTLASEGVIDEADFNELNRDIYGGLRPDSNLWNQVSNSDVNMNDVIDAFDIAYISRQLEEIPNKDEYVDGQLSVVPSVESAKAGEKFTVDVIGNSLTNIYALNLDIPYDKSKYDQKVVSSSKLLSNMTSFTRVFPDSTVPRIAIMYSNKGNQVSVSDDSENTKVMTFEFTAKTDVNNISEDLKPTFALLVDNNLHEKDALTDPTGPPTPEEPEKQPITLSSIQALNKDKQPIKDQAGYEIAKAIDGDEATQWHTYWNINDDYEENKVQFPAEIIIAMDKTYKLDKFVHVPRTDGGGGTITNATISYSNDNMNWKDITTEQWKADGLPKEYNFDTSISAKYIKLTIPENGATGGFISAQEFKLYADESSEPETDRITISAIEAKDKNNQTVKDQPGSEITKAIDGHDNSSDDPDIWHTYWSVNPDYEVIKFPVNIVLTMDKLYGLNKFEYLPREGGTNGTIKNAVLSYSADGNTWTEHGSVTWGGTGATEVVNFTTPINAKYFRITIPEGGSKGDFISAREFKLYGKESTAPTDPEQALKDAVDDAKSILDEAQNPKVDDLLKGIKNLSDAIKNYNSPQN